MLRCRSQCQTTAFAHVMRSPESYLPPTVSESGYRLTLTNSADWCRFGQTSESLIFFLTSFITTRSSYVRVAIPGDSPNATQRAHAYAPILVKFLWSHKVWRWFCPRGLKRYRLFLALVELTRCRGTQLPIPVARRNNRSTFGRYLRRRSFGSR